MNPLLALGFIILQSVSNLEIQVSLVVTYGHFLLQVFQQRDANFGAFIPA